MRQLLRSRYVHVLTILIENLMNFNIGRVNDGLDASYCQNIDTEKVVFGIILRHRSAFMRALSPLFITGEIANEVGEDDVFSFEV